MEYQDQSEEQQRIVLEFDLSPEILWELRQNPSYFKTKKKGKLPAVFLGSCGLILAVYGSVLFLSL